MNASTDTATAPVTLAEIADLVGGTLHGEGTARVAGIGPLEEAGPHEIAPLFSRRYLRFAGTSRAGAFLVSGGLEGALPEGRPRVVVDDPSRALLMVLRRFAPVDRPAPGVHATAVLGTGVRLGEGVGIGPYCVLGDGVSVGDGTRLEAHVTVGAGARVGSGCLLHPQVVVYPGVVIGDRVVLHAGVRLGSDGFGYVLLDGAHQKIPHLGGCVVGDDVEIGANTTVDRGSVGDTVIGAGVKIDNLVQVAHNVRIGPLSMLAALVGVAGSTRIGRGVWLGGQAGLINQIEIGDGARVAVATKVLRDVPAGETVSGHPARPHREDLRRQASLAKVPELMRRLKVLEAEVAALRETLGS